MRFSGLRVFSCILWPEGPVRFREKLLLLGHHWPPGHGLPMVAVFRSCRKICSAHYSWLLGWCWVWATHMELLMASPSTELLLLLDLVLPNHFSATGAGGGWAWAFSTWKNGRYLLATDVICVYVFMNESTYEKCLFIGHGLEALDVLINFEGLWSEYSHSYFPVWSEPLWIQSTSTLMPSEHTSKFRLLMCTGWMFLLPHHRYHHHFTPC